MRARPALVDHTQILEGRDLELAGGAPAAIRDLPGVEAVDKARGQRVVVGVFGRAKGTAHG